MQQVTARIHKELNIIELFFWSAPGELTSYSFREGHATATLEYMRTRTVPAGDDPRAEKLFRYWCGLPGHAGTVKLVKRLSANHM